jgi:putative glycosyltransferase (TIGR04372 family)
LGLPFIIVIRLISPFKKILIGSIKDPSRIGGQHYFLDWHMTEQKLGFHNNSINLFCCYFNQMIDAEVANKFWTDLWKRHLKILSFIPFGFSIYFWHNLLPWKKLNQITNYDLYLDPTVQDFKNGFGNKKQKRLSYIINNKEPNLFLTDNEISKGYTLLEKINVPRNINFICIQNRDLVYLNHYYQRHSQKIYDVDWSHHDYRNSDINNYVLAAENLVSENTYVFFTGVSKITSKKKLPKQIIEYRHTEIGSDFMDIFLGNQCKFYLCTDSGIAIVPQCFRKPIVFVNFPSIRRIYLHNLDSLVILKKFYSKSKKRLLSFKEVVQIENIVDDFGTQKFKDDYNDIEIIENSPEEIDDAAQEMNQRLEGSWVEKSEDINLQNQFWRINRMGSYKSDKLLIGTKFLKKYEHLLN